MTFTILLIKYSIFIIFYCLQTSLLECVLYNRQVLKMVLFVLLFPCQLNFTCWGVLGTFSGEIFTWVGTVWNIFPLEGGISVRKILHGEIIHGSIFQLEREDSFLVRLRILYSIWSLAALDLIIWKEGQGMPQEYTNIKYKRCPLPAPTYNRQCIGLS